MKKLLQTAVAVALVSASMASHANIVVNGGFETDIITGPWQYMTSLTGWTSTPIDDFEIQKGSDVGGLSSFNTAYEGIQYLELNTRHLTSISQNLSTVAGGLYSLTFAYSGRLDTPKHRPSTMEIYWDGSKLSKVKEKNDSGWVEYSYENLLSTSTSTMLTFKSTGPIKTPSYGSYIDGVSVSLVPEAETYAMMLAGLGIIGCIGRRRQYVASAVTA